MIGSKGKGVFIGIMTGTSLDAIDIAIVSFDRPGELELIGFYSEQWAPEIRLELYRLATEAKVDIDQLVRMNFQLARHYADCVAQASATYDLRPTDVRAIGLHGQTIRHIPPDSEKGHPGATLQWGSGNALAALTGIDVISDFRSGDVAVGGQGAPLVPMFDYAFLRSSKCSRLITNIGGISNVTWIPLGASADEVVAFDCGPGNMLIDSLSQKYFGRPYDDDGRLARSGSVHNSLLEKYLDDPYYNLLPPKSTGREKYGASYLLPLEHAVASGVINAEDAIATATELTARTIADSLRSLVLRSANTGAGINGSASHDLPIEVIISGGGALNTFLLERIRHNTSSIYRSEEMHSSAIAVITSGSVGIPPHAKEAIAFAYFAKAFVEEIPIHLPRTTGATRRIILGSLSRGSLGL